MGNTDSFYEVTRPVEPNVVRCRRRRIRYIQPCGLRGHREISRRQSPRGAHSNGTPQIIHNATARRRSESDGDITPMPEELPPPYDEGVPAAPLDVVNVEIADASDAEGALNR